MRILFLIIYILWAVSEIFLLAMFKSPRYNKLQDKNSLKYLWLIITLTLLLSIYLALIFPFVICHCLWLPLCGLAMIVSGMVIRFVSIFQLGKYFTVDVSTDINHHLVRTGLYSKIRHPSYTGSLISFAGFGLTLNSWISLIILMIPITWAFIYRIKVEEKVLENKFGEDYLHYSATTWRLIPYLY